MFTDYCLRSCAEKNHTGDVIPAEKGFIYYLERIASRDMTLTHLKKTAADILEADEWRVWKSKKYNSRGNLNDVDTKNRTNAVTFHCR